MQFDQTFPIEKSDFLLENDLSVFESDEWIGGFEFIDHRFDFRSFNNETITKLVESEYMKNEVKNFAKFIECSVKEYQTTLLYDMNCNKAE